MELRSRRVLSNSAAAAAADDAGNDNRGGGGSYSSGGEDRGDETRNNGSGEEFYVLDSDSVSSCSDDTDECEMVDESEFIRTRKNAKPPMGINIQQGSVPVATEASSLGAGPSNAPQPRAARVPGKRNRRSNRSKRDKGASSGPPLMWEDWEEEDEKWIDEHLSENCDLEDQNGFVNETIEPPTELIMPLLRYQKEWLSWALKQENSEVRGGILADEMGMGKTIQAIALVLAKRGVQRKTDGPCTPSVLSGSLANSPGIKATLVVCPVVAVTQWVTEIDRFTMKGSANVLVYHGPNREKSAKQFSDYDFVITTYSTVEAEFRKYMLPPKTMCEYCGKSFYEKKLWVHLKYYCGPHATRTEKQSKQNRKKQKTIPFTSLKKTEAGGDEYNGHGKERRNKENHEKAFDFGYMDCSKTEQRSLKEKSVLHSVNWSRIILDEAHFIKERRCNTAKAIFALESSYKWALSGTPLQNRVGELYSLVRFLKIVPYSYYLCKDCDCRTLDYRQSTECSNCPHNSVRHFCWWNKNISNPIQAFGNTELGRRAMILLKNKVLKNVVLRRTKRGRAADLALPPRIVTLRRDTLDVEEEDYYGALYHESQAQFNTYVRAGTVMNNYAHIFDLLTRLRQAVDHPYLVEYSKTASLTSRNMVDAENIEQVCSICHDPAEDSVVTSCAHVFCKACLLDFSSSLGQVSCPTCSTLLTVDMTAKPDTRVTVKTTLKGFKSSSILNRMKLDDFQTSTKIEALREEIRFMVERDGSAKGIVFSQFTSFLDLINYSLNKSGINCVQLVGNMTLAQRDAAIKKFTEDPDWKIFLISLKAGGVALNLTVASHVFLMDPWWNPAVERQAQDRIHRIGQYKPIRIVRFIIENTIEDRILQLQEKKELVFEGTVGGSTEALSKLTEADLRFLFVN